MENDFARSGFAEEDMAKGKPQGIFSALKDW